MDPRRHSFLQAVVGADGARALAKAADHSADLEWAILPRVILSWLEVVSHADYDDQIPGTDLHLTFRKSEGGFSGIVDVEDEPYGFRDASLYHLAGSVAVALGVEPEVAPELRSPALSHLGKSVDLLVRSRTLRKIARERSKGGAQAPGQAAAAQPPLAPEAPALDQPAGEKSQVGTQVAQPKKPKVGTSSTPKLPGAKKKPAMRVSKAEAAARCPQCRGSQFRAGVFAGCACFAELAKSVTMTPTADGYRLEFGSDWDAEAVTTLAEAFGK